MKSCFRCLKFLVTFFNGLIMLVGLAIEGFFVWVYFNNTILSDITSHTTYILYFFMVLGAIMAMMGFLGCCGALQESKCMLGTFFFFTLLLFGGQVAVCIWSYLNFKSLEGNFKTSLQTAMKQYYADGSVVTIVDALQENLHCCGSNGPVDWYSIQPKNSEKNSLSLSFDVPRSCCSVVAQNCSKTYVTPGKIPGISTIYTQGCSQKIFDYIKEHKEIFLGAIVAVSLIQVFALIFSLILCITFGKMDQYSDY